MRNNVLALALVISLLALAPIPDPGHPAEGIGPGTFAPGDFVFPDDLTVTQGLFVEGDILQWNNRIQHQVAYRATSSVDQRHEVRIPWPSTDSGPIILQVEVLVDTSSTGSRHYVSKLYYLTSLSSMNPGEVHSQTSYYNALFVAEAGRWHTIENIESDTGEGEIVIPIHSNNDRTTSVVLTAWGTEEIVELIQGAYFVSNAQGISTPAQPSLQLPSGVDMDFRGSDLLNVGDATFTGDVVVPTPTSPSHAATRGYVDDAITGLGAGNVTGGGSAGQVTYWTSSDAVTGNEALYWDSSSNQLRIGQAPGSALTLDRSLNIGSGALGDTVGVRFSVMDGSQNTRAAIRLDADTRELAFDHTWSSGGRIDYVFYRTSTDELVRIYGATGNLNLESGALQTNGTTRITNAGVLQNVDIDAGLITSGTLTAGQGGTGISGAGGTSNRVLLTTDGSTWSAGQIDLTTGQVTGALPVDRGGTGAATQSGARAGLGASTVGSNLFTLPNPGEITFLRVNADNTVSALNASEFRDAIGAGEGSGGVESVGLNMPGEFSVSGSPVTDSGTLSASWQSQSQNTVLAGPTSGSGTPVFRTLSSGDIPTISIGSGTSGTLSVSRGGTGATSFTINGVLLGSGTGAVTATSSGAANQVLRVPGGGGAPSFGAINLASSSAVTGNLPHTNAAFANQNVRTTDSPTFDGMTMTGKIANGGSAGIEITSSDVIITVG